VREGLGDKFGLSIQFMAQFIAGFVIGFYKGWKMALVMMSMTPVLAVCGGFMAKVRRHVSFILNPPLPLSVCFIIQ